MKPTKEEIERFFSKIDKGNEDECWLWTGGTKNKEGYGGFWLSELNNTVNCHKLMFIIVHNFDWEDIPDSIVIRHSCNNHPCVNPKHLKLGTFKDNSQDMVKAGNSLRGAKNPKYKHLTQDDINDMRDKFVNGITVREIAKIYNLSNGHTCNIVRNRIYVDYNYKPPIINHAMKFSNEVIKEVIQMKKNNRPISEILSKFNISQSQMYNILRGDQRKGV